MATSHLSRLIETNRVLILGRWLMWAGLGCPLAVCAACQPPPSGLVSWWPAEGNARDIVATNEGALVGNVVYTNGQVGHAFHFDGRGYVEVPDSPNLNPSGSFSIECWVFPDKDPAAWACLVGKWGDLAELHNQRSYAMGLQPGRAANFSISDAAGQDDLSVHSFDTPANLINLETWNHLVAVYEQPAGARRIYVNGSRVAERIDAPFSVLQSVAPLCFGARVRCSRYVDSYFSGSLDEVSFYDRALTDAEILALYRAGRAGKCATPVAPAITVQPASQAASIGAGVTFALAASGTWPLCYQWSFNGTRLSGQTASCLALTDIQPTNGGTYVVAVTNAFGCVTSAPALLTVCLPTFRVGSNGSRGSRLATPH